MSTITLKYPQSVVVDSVTLVMTLQEAQHLMGDLQDCVNDCDNDETGSGLCITTNDIRLSLESKLASQV